MIICFNATVEAKKALDELMATTQFKDVSQAICMALENYQILQLTVPQGGGVMPTPASVNSNENGAIKVSASPMPKTTTAGAPPLQYSPLFSLNNIATKQMKLAVAPETPTLPANVPPVQWIFGQYNKFLPVKASCRALLNLLAEHPSGVSVEDATSKIADAACGLGNYLRALDDKNSLRREDALAAAFPSSDIKGGGSRLRFGNQFVANIRQKQLLGFPADLRLMALNNSKELCLSLTKAGADFAALANPVLDTNGDVPLRKLSEPEIKFLLDHINQNVPEEASAYAAIIDAIAKGANTPDTIDKFLCRRFNLKVADDVNFENQITQTFLATQRTGAISRMVDMCLLSREKSGLRVTYVITKHGESFRSQTR